MQKLGIPVWNGLFPSWRSHPWGYRRKDNSAYFSATLLHTLFRYQENWLPEEAALLEKMRQLACSGVAPFQNKQGLPRYNFWKTNPDGHFPHGWLLQRFSFLRPPDDVDDSVMIYQMQQRTREEAVWLWQHMDSYANGMRGTVKNMEAAYTQLGAYCTFFCQNMPLGFDACVIINVLYFNRFYQIKAGPADRSSLEWIRLMLQRKDHVAHPGSVAPYYPQTGLILYHLAKLLSTFSIPELAPFFSQIGKDIQMELSKPQSIPMRHLLENAWMMLFKKCPTDAGRIVKNPFFFFVLPLSLEFEGKWAHQLALKPWTHIRFECPAMELALAIENQLWKTRLLNQNFTARI